MGKFFYVSPEINFKMERWDITFIFSFLHTHTHISVLCVHACVHMFISFHMVLTVNYFFFQNKLLYWASWIQSVPSHIMRFPCMHLLIINCHLQTVIKYYNNNNNKVGWVTWLYCWTLKCSLLALLAGPLDSNSFHKFRRFISLNLVELCIKYQLQMTVCSWRKY
jgi:hypothetical protein